MFVRTLWRLGVSVLSPAALLPAVLLSAGLLLGAPASAARIKEVATV